MLCVKGLKALALQSVSLIAAMASRIHHPGGVVITGHVLVQDQERAIWPLLVDAPDLVAGGVAVELPLDAGAVLALARCSGHRHP